MILSQEDSWQTSAQVGNRPQILGADGSGADDIQIRGSDRDSHILEESDREREGAVLEESDWRALLKLDLTVGPAKWPC